MAAVETMERPAEAGAPPGAQADAGGAAGAGMGPGGTDARQFVIFFVRGEAFAVPLAEVQEIIRMPDVVQLPLSPPSLEGLANLRGAVLPVINLRKVFNLEETEHDDATRVVVLDQGRPVGLVVDRMANVVTVEAEKIEKTDAIQGTIDSDLVVGMIKNIGNQAMVMILDSGQVVQREFQGMGRRSKGDAAHAGASLDTDHAAKKEDGSDEIQLVSFEVADQEYALPIEQVQEIVQVPEVMSHVPNAQGYVLGVMTLRNRLLPLISLRQLFGMPQSDLNEQHRIVVVSLGRGETAASTVGVVTDSVKEVLRVPRGTVDAMPALLAKDESLQDIASICRLDSGKRLVSILSAEHMFHGSVMEEVLASGGPAAEEDDMAEAAREDAGVTADDEEQFVVFRLVNEEYGVAIDAVQEIVRVPEELTRVPKTPPFIEGVVNLRGTVLPVVDQRKRFGLPSCERSDRQRIMVFTIGGVRTGFIVDSVSEVMRIPRKTIGPAPDLSEEQRNLIRRVANLEKQKRMILLLDVEHLLGKQEVKELKKRG